MAHFPPALSPNNQGSPGRESPVAGGGGSGSPGAAAGRCCDTGRPLFTDPITGHTVCSCQYDMLGYQRLPALGMYTAAPYPPEAMAAYFPALGPDQTPFYSSGAVGLDVKESLASGAATWPYPSVYHPYDAAFAGYPFNGYGMDLNGARRKNATRETTSTLKAWLNEHKKNPYPTKGEKIMLAIITKMTLTQVSTWFANARRRLKKENKMTWEPKNKTDDDEDNVLSDCDDKDKDDVDDDKMKMSKEGMLHVKAEHRLKDLVDEDDTEDDERKAAEMEMGHHHVLGGHHMLLKEESKDCGIPIPATKPKIWSLADTAACKTPPPPPPQQHGQGGWGAAQSFPAPPYSRYGGFFGGGAGGGFPEVQTDTPPQTPPNMKLPNILPPQGPPSCYNQAPAPQAQYQPAPGYFRHSPHKEYQHGLQQPQHHPPPPPDETAFKPFYKSSQMNGGFVSPV